MEAPDCIVDRVVVHLDLDCFFVQVERQINPALCNRPVAVQQHQDIISVSYEARELGVLKHMTPKEALAVCPELALVHVKKRSGTTKVTYEEYQSAHDKIWKILTRIVQDGIVEKASIDDAYLDLTSMVATQMQQEQSSTQSTQLSTSETIIFGDDKNLSSLSDHQSALGAEIVSSIRQAIFNELGYTASAGISHNKLLARMASGLNKPNKQTILKKAAIHQLLASYPVQKIPKLGVRLGKDKRKQLLEKLKEENVKTIGDIPKQFSIEQLASFLGAEKAEWLWNVTRGIDNEQVQNKGPPKSLMCSMTLTPISNNELELRNVLKYLASELAGRMDRDEAEHNRQPSKFQFNFRLVDEKEVSQSLPFSRLLGKIKTIRKERQMSSQVNDKELTVSAIVALCFELFKSAVGDRRWSLRWLGIIVNTFIKLAPVGGSLDSFFSKASSTCTIKEDKTNKEEKEKGSNEQNKEKEEDKEQEKDSVDEEKEVETNQLKRKRPDEKLVAIQQGTTEKGKVSAGRGKNSPKRKKNTQPVQKNTMLAYFSPKQKENT